MREIKFRAWSKLLNKMLSHEDLNKTLKNLTKIEYIAGIFLPLNSDVEVMQYTGLKDSNGNEIYEGDIVKIEDYFGEDIIGRVIYDEATAGYVFHKGNERNYFQMTLDLEYYVHYVIGNIYENKDLLD
jgi:uncharacterized phage protein (TIGR01671 family)